MESDVSSSSSNGTADPQGFRMFEMYVRSLTPLVVSQTSNEWPERTKEHCRWCVHPFEWTPFGVPQRWDSRDRRYELLGMFCSPNCARTFNRRSAAARGAAWEDRDMWLCKLAREKPWQCDRVTFAPPREMLSVFGGPMSIEQFRASHVISYVLTPQPWFRVTALAEMRDTVNRRKLHMREQEQRLKEIKRVQRVDPALMLRQRRVAAPRYLQVLDDSQHDAGSAWEGSASERAEQRSGSNNNNNNNIFQQMRKVPLSQLQQGSKRAVRMPPMSPVTPPQSPPRKRAATGVSSPAPTAAAAAAAVCTTASLFKRQRPAKR